MNVHELLDILIVATGTLAVFLTAAILELIRERKEAKRTARNHREEVKAQLAKCPLVWEEKNGIISTKVLSWVGFPCVDFEIVLGESLHLSTYLSEDDRLPSILIQEEEEEEKSVERLKEKAEAHRLDLTCRMLGIKE